MSAQIDLILLGQQPAPFRWELGDVFTVEATPPAVSSLIAQRLVKSSADACFFWDARLGTPDASAVQRVCQGSGQVWHAGLRLGTAGQPRSIDFVQPTWMLNCDPDSNNIATSWRVCLSACVISTEILRQMGGVHPDFKTLEAAALEMGHRYIVKGVVCRSVPALVPRHANLELAEIPFEDELRFVHYRYERFWSRWALLRAVLTRDAPLREAIRSARIVFCKPRPTDCRPLHSSESLPASAATEAGMNARVTVLIPTVDRYDYLKTVLRQLCKQTVPPYEIIIVDQTAARDRDESIISEFANLPIQMRYLDRAGQCSSRNIGLQVAGGDYVLFLDDDDDKIPADLIESHLKNLHRYGASVSAGVADEHGAGPLPVGFRYRRVSDVLPTNNALLCRSLLSSSGTFDLAYECGPRADHDLGMRLYLAGALIMLDPQISVVHHHAARGGLRVHSARKVTYASSRQRIMHRHNLSATEIYLARRYFTARQLREMCWMRLLGTFAIHAGTVKRLAKLFISLIFLPHTLWILRRRARQADSLRPRIGRLTMCSEGIDEAAAFLPRTR